MDLQPALAPRRPARGVSRLIWRGLSLLLVLAALLVMVLMLRLPDAASDVAIGATTRFDYVAVFPPGTSAIQVETWRSGVLRVHETGCFRGNPCIARSLRGAELGSARQFAFGFDLMRDAPPHERAAVLAAAQQALPGMRIAVGSSLQQAIE